MLCAPCRRAALHLLPLEANDARHDAVDLTCSLFLPVARSFPPLLSPAVASIAASVPSSPPAFRSSPHQSKATAGSAAFPSPFSSTESGRGRPGRRFRHRHPARPRRSPVQIPATPPLRAVAEHAHEPPGELRPFLALPRAFPLPLSLASPPVTDSSPPASPRPASPAWTLLGPAWGRRVR